MRGLILIFSVGLFFSGLSFASTDEKISELKKLNTEILYNLKSNPSSVSWMRGYPTKVRKFCRSVNHCRNSKLQVSICKAQPGSLRNACLNSPLGFCNECVGLKNVLRILHDKCKNKLKTSQDCRIYYGMAINDAYQLQNILKPFE